MAWYMPWDSEKVRQLRDEAARQLYDQYGIALSKGLTPVPPHEEQRDSTETWRAVVTAREALVADPTRDAVLREGLARAENAHRYPEEPARDVAFILFVVSAAPKWLTREEIEDTVRGGAWQLGDRWGALAIVNWIEGGGGTGRYRLPPPPHEERGKLWVEERRDPRDPAPWRAWYLDCVASGRWFLARRISFSTLWPGGDLGKGRGR